MQVDKGLQWGHVKFTQHFRGRFRYIHTYSGIIRHIRLCSSIINHIWELFRHIQIYSEPCVTMLYIYLEPEEHSEPCQRSTMKCFVKIVKIVHNCIFLRKSQLLSRCQLFTFSTLYNEYYISF